MQEKACTTPGTTSCKAPVNRGPSTSAQTNGKYIKPDCGLADVVRGLFTLYSFRPVADFSVTKNVSFHTNRGLGANVGLHTNLGWVDGESRNTRSCGTDHRVEGSDDSKRRQCGELLWMLKQEFQVVRLLRGDSHCTDRMLFKTFTASLTTHTHTHTCTHTHTTQTYTHTHTHDTNNTHTRRKQHTHMTQTTHTLMCTHIHTHTTQTTHTHDTNNTRHKQHTHTTQTTHTHTYAHTHTHTLTCTHTHTHTHTYTTHTAAEPWGEAFFSETWSLRPSDQCKPYPGSIRNVQYSLPLLQAVSVCSQSNSQDQLTAQCVQNDVSLSEAEGVRGWLEGLDSFLQS